MVRRIDLDEARRERREQRENEPLAVTIDQQDYALPDELPFEVVEKLGPLRGASDENSAPEVAAAILSIFETLLGEQYVDFKKHRPSGEDLTFLLKAALKAYGVELGESQASDS